MSLEDRLAGSIRALDVADHAALGVACSGGADSIALLHLLSTLRSRLVVLHVDHGLRDGSTQDADFVVATAHRLGLSAHVARVQVESHGSVEAAARTARYTALTSMAQRHGLPFVATAHTTDDQAETVLLRAMRGGSLDAIAPRRGIFVRPLLGFRGAELRAWLEDNDVDWREDPTNTDTRFERNWVRHVLLPQLRGRRVGVDLALAQVAAHAADDRVALDAIASEMFSRAQIDDAGVLLPPDVDHAPVALARRVFRSALRHFGVEASTGALDAMRTGRATCGGVEIWRAPSGLAFTRPVVAEPIPLASSSVVTDDVRGLRVRVGPSYAAPWRWRTTGVADPLMLRARVHGDRVGSKKVQDILVDAKVPRPLRDRVGIVATDTGAVAVVGHAANRNPASSDIVIDVEWVSSSWSRELLWRTR